MSTITLTVVGTTVGTLTSTTELDQPRSDRLMAYLAHEFGTGIDADGLPFARTPQEMVEAYWGSIVRGTYANVMRFEEAKGIEAVKQTLEQF